jgi:D-alanine-D-alanine ligase
VNGQAISRCLDTQHLFAMDGNKSSSSRRIVVLAGGDSAERAVSLASGERVAIALSLAGYQPQPVDPASADIGSIDWRGIDACFIALHGGAGEDGRIQQRLEEIGVAYTGSGPGASRLAMSKSAAKRRFAAGGVPTLPFVELDAASDRGHLAELQFPLVVKPDGQGSSLGVSIARGPDQLAACVQAAAQYDAKIVAEPYVCGREFTVSLLGRRPLPMIEVIARQPIFTYDAKYENSGAEYRFDSGLPAQVDAVIYRVAVAAADALGTVGLVRVDVIVDERYQPWVLEVNTIPGMTDHSLAPKAALASGITMPMLVDWMARDAIGRRTSVRDSLSVHREGILGACA